MSEPTDPIAQLIVKWRETAKRKREVWGNDGALMESVFNQCADELEAALRAQRTEGRPQCLCSAPSEEGTIQITAACPEHGDGTPYAEAKRQYWAGLLQTPPERTEGRPPEENYEEDVLKWMALAKEQESQIETLTASLRAIQEERDTLKAIVENPSKWMNWCDSRVLDRAEAAEAKLKLVGALDAGSLSPVIDNGKAAERQLTAGGRSEGRATLKALVDKLDIIAADPQFQSMAVMNFIHGVQYTGPNWAAELAAAKAFLATKETT